MSGTLQLKPGASPKRQNVNSRSMTPICGLAIQITYSVWSSMFSSTNCVITAICDGKHKEGSRHYEGEAFDMRSRNIFDHNDKLEFVEALKQALGPEFDVILEGVGEDWEHFHIEFDPKGATLKQS